jgi:hypothetical protein
LNTGSPKSLGLDVLRHEIHLACKIFVDDFFARAPCPGELPVARHDIHAQQFASIDHVLAVGPQVQVPEPCQVSPPSSSRRTRAAGFQALDQGGQVGKATNLAIAAWPPVQSSSRSMRGLLAVPGGHLGHLEQVLAHQMGQACPFMLPIPKVDAGLSEVDGLELRVAIRHVQKRHRCRNAGRSYRPLAAVAASQLAA